VVSLRDRLHSPVLDSFLLRERASSSCRAEMDAAAAPSAAAGPLARELGSFSLWVGGVLASSVCGVSESAIGRVDLGMGGFCVNEVRYCACDGLAAG